MCLLLVSLALIRGARHSSAAERRPHTPTKKYQDILTEELDATNPADYVILLKRYKLILQTTVASYKVGWGGE